MEWVFLALHKILPCSSLFSLPPCSTPYCTHPPTPTSIKPLPNVHCAHTHAPTASSADTPTSLRHTPRQQDFPSQALILTSTQTFPTPEHPISHLTPSSSHRSSVFLAFLIFLHLIPAHAALLPGPGNAGAVISFCTFVIWSCHKQERQPACACLFSHSQAKTEDGKKLAARPISGNNKNSCFPSSNP